MKKSERTITITYKGFLFKKKVTFPINELIPDIPEHVPANHWKVEKAVSVIAQAGFTLRGDTGKLEYITPSRLLKIVLNFPSPAKPQ